MMEEMVSEFKDMCLYDKIQLVAMMFEDVYGRNPQFIEQFAQNYTKDFVDFRDVVNKGDVYYIREEEND